MKPSLSHQEFTHGNQVGGARKEDHTVRPQVERPGGREYPHRTSNHTAGHSGSHGARGTGSGAHGFARPAFIETHVDRMLVDGPDEGNIGTPGKMRMRFD